MNKKLIAMMSALVMCFSAVPYTASAEDIPENLPEWIPQNFTDALDFDNDYGITHIEDGLICCVRLKDNRREYSTEYSDGSNFELLMNETYSFELPEKPDESDEEAYQEYLDFLHKNGIDEFYVENDLVYVSYDYEVTVYSLKPSESVEINWIQKYSNGNTDTTTLSFESSADGVITETDLYGWLPDTMGECYSYTKKNGEISVHNGYIVVCDEICWDGGFSMVIESIGTAELEFVKKETSSIRYIVSLDGGSSTEVQLYKPVTSGQVKVTYKNAQDWQGGMVAETFVKYYDVDEDGNITEVEGITAGDCNGDGQFTISDVVMFQKWLSGTGELTNWQNADLTWDNKLDVFDLVLMKKSLINGGV